MNPIFWMLVLVMAGVLWLALSRTPKPTSCLE